MGKEQRFFSIVIYINYLRFFQNFGAKRVNTLVLLGNELCNRILRLIYCALFFNGQKFRLVLELVSVYPT
jgi:hypothetical protein